MKKNPESRDKLFRFLKKSIGVVRPSVLLLLVFLIIGTTFVYSQNAKLSLNIRDSSLKEILQEIEKKSEFHFIYENGRFDADKKVDFQVEDKSVEEVLKILFARQGISYKITESNLILINQAMDSADNKGALIPKDPRQQPKTVTGRVTDLSGQPLPGVTIVVQGTTVGAITDINGNYKITLPDEKGVLQFSFVGYLTEEIGITGQTYVDVSLVEDITKLDEVVVVAFGVKDKATVTGALSSVGTSELLQSPSANITNALSGVLPGVTTVQTSGQPGKDFARVFVRGVGSLTEGASAPLVMVDGVQRSFAQLDPNEIESISILKDASATAVFGVRGANGVILVTTKRGRKGETTVQVSSSLGIQSPVELVSQASSYDYARFYNMKMLADGRPESTFTPEQVEAYRTGIDPIMYPNVDWNDYMFKKYFIQNRNNVNISGGGDKVKYYVSLAHLYQNGILKQFDELPYNNNYRFTRYNYRTNLDLTLSRSTTMKVNIGGNIGDIHEPRVVENVPHVWTVAQVWAQPIAGPGIINGKRTIVPKNNLPVAELRDGLFAFYGYGYDASYSNTINIDVELTQDLGSIVRGLKTSVKGAYDTDYALHKQRQGYVEYQQANYKSSLIDPELPQTDPYFDKTIVYTSVGRDVDLNYSEWTSRDRRWYLEARLNYERTLGPHQLTGLALYNQSRDYYPWTYNHLPIGYVGFVGRTTYGYKYKYLFEFNVGYNGSENFAPGPTRYGLFPAVSAGWVASEEPFMRNQDFIDFLKFRASYGKVGNDRGGIRFLYMPSVWTPSGSYSFGTLNPTPHAAYQMGIPGNRAVSWETAVKQNYGVDINILDDRLEITADYFLEQRTGILIAPNSLPEIIATSSPPLNLGKVDNQGYEVMLRYGDRIGTDVSFDLGANVTYAKNKIIDMDEVPKEYDYQYLTGGSTGRQTDLFKFIRLYQERDFDVSEDGSKILNPELPQPYLNVSPGDAMYADLNGDGTVNENDRMVHGYSGRPEYVFGIDGALRYKGLSFSMQWVGATNVAKMLEEDYRIPFTNAGARGLLNYFVEESWTPENQEGATLPRLAEEPEVWNAAKSTLWLKDASYLRLKTANLSYSINNYRLLKSIGFKSAMVTLSGYNLLTFTPLEWVDPEGATSNNGEYPIAKVYNLELRLTF